MKTYTESPKDCNLETITDPCAVSERTHFPGSMPRWVNKAIYRWWLDLDNSLPIGHTKSMVIGLNYLAYEKQINMDVQNKTYDWLTIYNILSPRLSVFVVLLKVIICRF